ncbi:MAG TPA: hypothetical protein PLP75_13010 [Burkholderiales bacterium]|nr:hypothetical protein [Burkholderiales bacterium]
MKFSERMGFVKVSDAFQIDSISQELRNRIYNFIDEEYLTNDNLRSSIYKKIHINFYKLKQNQFKYYNDGGFLHVKSSFEDSFDNSEWYKIYDLLEFILQMYTFYSNFAEYVAYCSEAFIIKINQILEEERSGYRIVDGLVTPIIDNNEIESIEEAINQQDNTSIHLRTALQHLSNKHKPDYRNSIKESISAVEFMLRTITGESTAGKALNKVQSKIHLPSVLKDGFEKIYAYTNGNEGIRHALMEETKVTLEEAKFMLVSCSAFINYLKAKHLAT